MRKLSNKWYYIWFVLNDFENDIMWINVEGIFLCFFEFVVKFYFIYLLKDFIVDENSDIIWCCEGIVSLCVLYVWYKNVWFIIFGIDGIEIYLNVLKIKNF